MRKYAPMAMPPRSKNPRNTRRMNERLGPVDTCKALELPVHFATLRARSSPAPLRQTPNLRGDAGVDSGGVLGAGTRHLRPSSSPCHLAEPKECRSLLGTPLDSASTPFRNAYPRTPTLYPATSEGNPERVTRNNNRNKNLRGPPALEVHDGHAVFLAVAEHAAVRAQHAASLPSDRHRRGRLRDWNPRRGPRWRCGARPTRDSCGFLAQDDFVRRARVRRVEPRKFARPLRVLRRTRLRRRLGPIVVLVWRDLRHLALPRRRRRGALPRLGLLLLDVLVLFAVDFARFGLATRGRAKVERDVLGEVLDRAQCELLGARSEGGVREVRKGRVAERFGG